MIGANAPVEGAVRDELERAATGDRSSRPWRRRRALASPLIRQPRPGPDRPRLPRHERATRLPTALVPSPRCTNAMTRACTSPLATKEPRRDNVAAEMALLLTDRTGHTDAADDRGLSPYAGISPVAESRGGSAPCKNARLPMQSRFGRATTKVRWPGPKIHLPRSECRQGNRQLRGAARAKARFYVKRWSLFGGF
jgi:hypothetical protein